TSLFTYLPSICSLLLTRRPPPSLLFPYTTLFRSGIPLNLPVVSLGETNLRPTAMLWRNMAAMATEEMLRANPIDGVVLLGGCDKTSPSLLMAAASVDLPAVVVPGGPMLTGTFHGVPLGCGTDVWRLSEEVRAGTLTVEQFTRSESAMIRSCGHCN